MIKNFTSEKIFPAAHEKLFSFAFLVLVVSPAEERKLLFRSQEIFAQQSCVTLRREKRKNLLRMENFFIRVEKLHKEKLHRYVRDLKANRAKRSFLSFKYASLVSKLRKVKLVKQVKFINLILALIKFVEKNLLTLRLSLSYCYSFDNKKLSVCVWWLQQKALNVMQIFYPLTIASRWIDEKFFIVKWQQWIVLSRFKTNWS